MQRPDIEQLLEAIRTGRAGSWDVEGHYAALAQYSLALEAENRRLREALEEIENMTWPNAGADCRNKARAALTPATGEGENNG